MGARMMTVEGIGKEYRIGGPRSIDLRGGLKQNIDKLLNRGGEHFWAVRDVSFQLDRGDALGIIGRNGAGKSTLLKILSRITVPTKGRFTIEGRVSSLLEVGTGFHPELSGRENIFLNGTILGMRRNEVRRKFDEIVDFSGVERFIDTPVKHYSSGQKVRLAFAVAAHLEPEVLIIDEVLAVGDAEFQRKCLGKMKDVAGHGRTILFVSHNMSAINSLCKSCLLLDNGQVEAIGDPGHITTLYMNHNDEASSGSRDFSALPMSGDGVGRLIAMRWTDEEGATVDHAPVTRRFGLEIEHEVIQEGHSPQPVIMLYSSKGEHIFTTFPGIDRGMGYGKGRHTTTVWFPADLFNEDTYYVSFWLATWLPFKIHQIHENIMNIKVLDDLDSPTRSPSYAKIRGVIRPRLDWDVTAS
ncbi:MAG: polysaccharide ABC transporter ATP-binding protein [Flavobacteriales bacterium]